MQKNQVMDIFDMDPDQFGPDRSTFTIVSTLSVAFEHRWNPERTYSMEECLSEGQGLVTCELFMRILEVDMLLGRKHNSLPTEEEYISRFPAYREIITKLYDEILNYDDLEQFDLTGKILDETFSIEELLGSGGMGTVYRGTDLNLKRPVAIKVISRYLRHDEAVQARFREEVANQGQLDDENIVRIYYYGEYEQVSFLVMEFVPGLNLNKYILGQKEYSLSLKESAEMILQVACGLRCIHINNIVHRDIKPSNLIRRDNDGRIKICDLGLGMLWNAIPGEEQSEFRTEMKTRQGTCGYIAPELENDPNVFSPRSDIYSLGVTFYFLLTGINLSSTSGYSEEVLKSFRPDIKDETILSLLDRMLKRDPQERIQSAEEVVDILQQWQENCRVESSKEKGYSLKRFYSIIAVLFLLVAGLLIFYSWQFLEQQHLYERNVSPSNIEVTDPLLEDLTIKPTIGFPKEYINEQGMKFCLIPTGRFVMGNTISPPREYNIMKCRYNNSEIDRYFCYALQEHHVIINRPFYLARFEVTVGDFQKFVEETGYVTAQERGTAVLSSNNQNDESDLEPTVEKKNWRNSFEGQTLRHPVVYVNWKDTQEYLRWLNAKNPPGVKEGLEFEYRLPSDAEWEYACRAGTKTLYFWGDFPEQGKGYLNGRDENLLKGEEGYTIQKNSRRTSFPFDDGFSGIAPVGCFKPNSFGLYDMAGNCFEWCNDWFFQNDEPATVVDPTGPATGTKKVIRGGDWQSSVLFCSSAYRIAIDPNACSRRFGFRLAIGQKSSL